MSLGANGDWARSWNEMTFENYPTKFLLHKCVHNLLQHGYLAKIYYTAQTFNAERMICESSNAASYAVLPHFPLPII